MQGDQALIDAAIEQLRTRWPGTHRGAAAVVYLVDGSILAGVTLGNINAAMTLCAETGPVCQAFKIGKAVVASVCVAIVADEKGFHVLAPCGACEKRLALWGPRVEVGVACANGESAWQSKPLIEVDPYYWAPVYARESEWPSQDQHAD
jgi:cytidine deaminase